MCGIGKMNKQNPLISIIVPIHNAANFLEECLNSIVYQSYSNLEIILIDDNSTDGSDDIINYFAIKDSRIRNFSQFGGSAAKTRNYGLSKARGDYIAFVDADDVINKDMIKNLYVPLRGTLSGFSMSKFTTNVKQFEHSKGTKKVQKLSGEFLYKLKMIQKTGYPSFGPVGKLYTRNIFDDIRYPNFKIHEDTAVILQIVSKTDAIFLVDSIDYYYRVNLESITHSKITVNNMALFKKNQIQITFVKSKYPEALNYIYQLCLNENDYIAMKCIEDGTLYAEMVLEKIRTQNILFSKIIGHRSLLYKNKIIYKLYLKITAYIWNNDFIRGFAKKIVT